MKSVIERNLGFMGYPNYSVDTDGNVITYARNGTGKHDKIKKPTKCYNYQRIGLVKDGVHKLYRIHQLVAMAFLPNPHGYTQINHKDHNPHNNKLSNLEWCDAAYNIKYSSERYKGGKNKPKPVVAYTLDGEFVGEYPSGNAAAEALGVYANSIYYVCKGGMRQTGGYIFKYKEECNDVKC